MRPSKKAVQAHGLLSVARNLSPIDSAKDATAIIQSAVFNNVSIGQIQIRTLLTFCGGAVLGMWRGNSKTLGDIALAEKQAGHLLAVLSLTLHRDVSDNRLLLNSEMLLQQNRPAAKSRGTYGLCENYRTSIQSPAARRYSLAAEFLRPGS
jgi:hypothetical protein